MTNILRIIVWCLVNLIALIIVCINVRALLIVYVERRKPVILCLRLYLIGKSLHFWSLLSSLQKIISIIVIWSVCVSLELWFVKIILFLANKSSHRLKFSKANIFICGINRRLYGGTVHGSIYFISVIKLNRLFAL